MIVFLHAVLFVALSSFNPASVMCLLHASFHLRFGLPLLLFPAMSTMCSSFILLTWLYHLSRFSVIFWDAYTTLAVPLMCSFRILSLRTSISASSSHLLLVVLLVFSLLPMPLDHITELVRPQFCKPFPSVLRNCGEINNEWQCSTSAV